MQMELLPDGRIVNVGYGLKEKSDFFSQCDLCSFDRFSCGNYINREIRLPKSYYNDPSKEIILIEKFENTTTRKPTGDVMVDGIEAGFYNCEEDVPKAEKCGWFEPYILSKPDYNKTQFIEKVLDAGEEYEIENAFEEEGVFYFEDNVVDDDGFTT